MFNKKKKVLIEVSGGVVYITDIPKGVEVEIIDFDEMRANGDIDD